MSLGFPFFFTSIMLGVGLAMDAFSVSLANGLNEPKMKKHKMCGVAGVFAGFQFAMPMIGWILNVVAMKYYPLTAEKMEEVRERIAEIKAEYAKG